MPRPSNPHTSSTHDGAQRYVGYEGGMNAALRWVDETLAEYERHIDEEYGQPEAATVRGARQYLRDRA